MHSPDAIDAARDRLTRGLAVRLTLQTVKGPVRIYAVPGPLYDEQGELLVAAEGRGAVTWKGDAPMNPFKLVSGGFTLALAGLVSDFLNAIMQRRQMPTLIASPTQSETLPLPGPLETSEELCNRNPHAGDCPHPQTHRDPQPVSGPPSPLNGPLPVPSDPPPPAPPVALPVPLPPPSGKRLRKPRPPRNKAGSNAAARSCKALKPKARGKKRAPRPARAEPIKPTASACSPEKPPKS